METILQSIHLAWLIMKKYPVPGLVLIASGIMIFFLLWVFILRGFHRDLKELSVYKSRKIISEAEEYAKDKIDRADSYHERKHNNIESRYLELNNDARLWKIEVSNSYEAVKKHKERVNNMVEIAKEIQAELSASKREKRPIYFQRMKKLVMQILDLKEGSPDG